MQAMTSPDNLRMARWTGAGPHYPTGRVIGHAFSTSVTTPIVAQGNTVSAIEGNSIFLEGIRNTPVQSAFVHRIICLTEPAVLEQFKLHTPVRRLGAAVSDAIVSHLPEYDPANPWAGRAVELGFMVIGGFSIEDVTLSDGVYQLIYELIPIGKSQ